MTEFFPFPLEKRYQSGNQGSIMSEKKLFELSSGVHTQDGFNVELKGFYVGEESNANVLDALRSFSATNHLEVMLNLIEEESIHDILSINATQLKLTTVNAIRTDPDRYAINPDLEGKKQKKGFFSRFRRG